MNEKIKVLLEEMNKNEKLQKEIKGTKDLDSLYAVTTKYVDGYTKDELKEVIEKLKSADSTELSDNDLEAVAGGSSFSEIDKTFEKLIEYVKNHRELFK